MVPILHAFRLRGSTLLHDPAGHLLVEAHGATSSIHVGFTPFKTKVWHVGLSFVRIIVTDRQGSALRGLRSSAAADETSTTSSTASSDHSASEPWQQTQTKTRTAPTEREQHLRRRRPLEKASRHQEYAYESGQMFHNRWIASSYWELRSRGDSSEPGAPRARRRNTSKQYLLASRGTASRLWRQQTLVVHRRSLATRMSWLKHGVFFTRGTQHKREQR